MHIIFYCYCLLSSHKLAPDLPPLLAFITYPWHPLASSNGCTSPVFELPPVCQLCSCFILFRQMLMLGCNCYQLLWFLPGCHTAVPLHFSFSQVESSSTKDVCSVPFAILFHLVPQSPFYFSSRLCKRKRQSISKLSSKANFKVQRGSDSMSKPITSPCFLHSYSVLNWMIIR